MIALITLLAVIVAYLLSQTFLDFILGAPKDKGYLKRYYSHITGIAIKRVSWQERLLRLNKEQLAYAFDLRQYLRYVIPTCAVLFLFSYFFFRSFPFALIISIVGLFYPRIIVLKMIKKRKALLNNQLKEAMFSLASSLKAGSSLQTAIERSVGDLEQIFQDAKEAPILIEFKQLSESIQMGFSVEETLTSFKNRVQLEDVDDMVNATIIAKNRGGNLAEVFMNISKTISEKIEIKNEIDVLTASKRMESKILSFMPIVMVTCISLLSPTYMQPLYHSIIGRILMLTGFVLVALNYFVSRRIIQIDV